MLDSLAPLLVVLGPTGSGKSELALNLAARFGGEIVSCDSVQVHCGFDLGSAKLPPAERKGIPHHLIDVLPADAELTAGAYTGLARTAIAQITARGALPIVAGGTGFYLRALLDGLSPAPPRDEALRMRLAALSRRRPLALHRFLARRDPISAQRIHPNDLQKLIRATELTLRASRPASAIQSQPRAALTGYRVLKLGLQPPRDLLYARLNQRARAMFERGLLAETAALLAAGINPRARALASLGYKQAVQALRGEVSVETAIADCQTKSRQYAKRQLTWFRAESDVRWLPGFGTDLEIGNQAIETAQIFLNSVISDVEKLL